jgi:acetoin utilization deacetylase AcuC-like enzyme
MLPVFDSEHFLHHDTGRFHPEKPGRITAIREALRLAPWADRLDWRTPTLIETRSPRPWMEAIHGADYLAEVERIAARGGGRLDGDTVVSARTYDVAMLAVNAWIDGVDYALVAGKPCFVLARPPGHHAEPDRGMGFCIFSNAAIAAQYALGQIGAQKESTSAARVAIFDWDVHHGNGTQAVVETRPQLAYCSLHEFPHYPGTGRADETGQYGNVLNIPMQAGSTMVDYRARMEAQVMPFLRAFEPDLLIVSAGYDANQADPLANIDLQPEDYGVLMDYCLQVSPKIVLGLEGGYDFDSLGRSVVATLDRCLAHENG